MLTCAACGQQSPKEFKFCGRCGAPLTEEVAERREERKVVTVLFADLVGFTARSERLDPEEVASFLHPYHRALRLHLEHFGGTVEKFIGDAVMALFGAPIAHGDDPERAVRAALAIRDAITGSTNDLQLRIGINTGEALVTINARVDEGEGMAAGDVVNTAARLQSAAPVNGILVGGATYRATRGAIDYRPREPLSAKGKSDPVPVWEALSAQSHANPGLVSPVRTSFVGRADELTRLTSTIAAAQEERSPQLATIVGAAGIGKSRIVRELLQTPELGATQVTLRQGRSLPYGEGSSYWALGEIVKAEAGILESDNVERAEEKLIRAVSRVEPDEREAEWLYTQLRPLVGLSGEAELGERLAAVFAAWRRFFERIAEQRPLVLVFEDIHWADDGLLDFITELATIAAGPIVVICTARPDLLERHPAWGSGAMNLTLPPLTDHEVAELLGSVLEQAAPSGDFERELLERVGGNPLFAEQYARMLSEDGADKLGDLPESVHAVIAARLDALPSAAKEFLQDGAVIGKVFWLGAVIDIGDIDADQADGLIRDLEQRELVRLDSRSAVEGEAQYAFHHALVRDVAYSQIPRAQRVDKHRRAAGWIQALSSDRTQDRAEMLGQHYLQALEFARLTGQDTTAFAQVARDALHEAGTRAWWLGAYSAAARFYGSALELTGRDEPDRARLLFAHGRALFWSEDAGLEAMAEAVDALAEQGDIEGAAEAASWTSKALWMQGDRDAAYRSIDRALALVASLPPSPSVAEVLTRRASYHMFAGEYQAAIRRCQETMPLLERHHLDAARARALNLLGTSRVFSGDPGGVHDLEQSLTFADAVNSAELLHAAYENLFSAYMQLGELHRAADTAAAMRESVARRGAAHIRRWVVVDRVRECYASGLWDEAVAAADEFIAAVENGSPHYLEAPCRSIRAVIRLGRGDPAGAGDDAVRALEAGRRAKDIQVLGPALWAMATLSLAEGRAEASRAFASELLVGSPAGVWNLLEWACLCDFAWVIVELGQEAELAAILRERPSTSWSEAALAILSGDLPRATIVLGSMGNRAGEARARAGIAERLAHEGRHLEADEALAPALAYYRRVEAVTLLREAEGLTRASAL